MPSGPPPPTPVPLTRRRALAAGLTGGLVVLGTAGCELDAGPAADPSPDAAGTTGSSTGGTAAGDPDQRLVDDVRRRLAGTAAVVTAAGRGRPALARALRDLERLHRRHLAALPGQDVPPSRTRVPGDDEARRREVAAAESRLQTHLADAALEARSGPLASLLASMSAAVAQQLAAGVGGRA